MKLSGITFIHNGVDHDYCFEECLVSMLGICDEVVCVESGSTDETPQKLAYLLNRFDHLKIVQADWKPVPLVKSQNIDWTMDLANLARENATGGMVIYAQADEVLHEKDYTEIRRMTETKRCYTLDRLNFWIDPWHLVPDGRVCGKHICRIAPRRYEIAWGSEHIACNDAEKSAVNLFHYGFIREGSAFRKKSEVMSQNFIGTIDPIIYEAEKHGTKYLRNAWPETELLNFNGSHPHVAKPWLNKHGFDV